METIIAAAWHSSLFWLEGTVTALKMYGRPGIQHQRNGITS
jgi:hypothetical protein